MNDTINTLVNAGIEIGTNYTGNDTLIKGIDNSVIGSVISIIAGLIIRSIEKRRLRKKGKLTE